MRVAISVQSGAADRALLAASTLHATGLNLDTVRIQSGISCGSMKTGDRNVIGSRMKFDAPMTDSVRRMISAIAFDSAPNGTATSTTIATTPGYWTIGGDASSNVLPHAIMIHAAADPSAGARIGSGVATVTP